MITIKLSGSQTAADMPSTKKQVHACPVCMGRGFVSGGFYSSVGQTWVSSTTLPEECRSCQGKGYIIVKQND